MTTELFMNSAKEVESAITALGANGKGLHEKIDSLSEFLGQELKKKLRYIATVRNKVAHESLGGDYFKEQEGFISACRQCLTEIEKIAKNVNSNSIKKKIADRIAERLKESSVAIEKIVTEKTDAAIREAIEEFMSDRRLEITEDISGDILADVKKLLDQESLTIDNVVLENKMTVDPVSILDELDRNWSKYMELWGKWRRLEEKSMEGVEPIKDNALGYIKATFIGIGGLVRGRSLEDIGNDYLMGGYRTSKYDKQLDSLSTEMDKLSRRAEELSGVLQKMAPGVFGGNKANSKPSAWKE